MLSPINKEMGRKPYITTKGIDGGYVNEMRRTAQRIKEPVREPLQKRSRGAVIDASGEAVASYIKTALGQTSRQWISMADTPNGDIYAGVSPGDVYLRAGGAGDFLPLSQTSRTWDGLAGAPNGDAYACIFNGDIYIRAGGTGAFSPLTQTSRAYTRIACAPNGDVYTCVFNGDIFLRPGGVGDFVALNQTARFWNGVGCVPNGDVYGVVNNGGIFLRAGGSGDFVTLNQTTREWIDVSGSPNGDVFAQTNGGDIYLRSGGVGDFVSIGQGQANQFSITVDPEGNLYTGVYGADIYKITAPRAALPPKEGIVQTHVIPERTFPPRFKNLKPYANQSFDAMQRYALPVDHTGKEQPPDPEQALPVLASHIDEVFRFVRSGSPVVVDIPTNDKDPVSGVEIYARVDGFASVAPNGTSVIFNPGASDAALLIVHTKSGQQCTVNLMAK